jgi:hypothetical protein
MAPEVERIHGNTPWTVTPTTRLVVKVHRHGIGPVHGASPEAASRRTTMSGASSFADEVLRAADRRP